MFDLTHSLRAYPEFGAERVFLSSSSDVRQLRQRACDMLDGLLNRLVPEKRIEAFDWERYAAQVPMDQRLNRQQNLPRPADPNCVGAVVLLGERIGEPLVEYDVSVIANVNTWMQGPYRLVTEWPRATDMAEQLELVRKGCFPLTGTVFEALDALGAGKPVHIAYLADRPVSAGTQVRLNGWQWRYETEKLLSPDAAAEWLQGEYAIQTEAVRNFLLALKRTRHIPCCQNTEDALRGIRAFLETAIVKTRLSDENPYRFLDYYDVIDGDDLPGRGEATRDVVIEMRRRIDPKGPPMIVQITGESGCGKSSFLRAGVLAALIRPNELGRFVVVAIRPTDFHDEDGLPDKQILSRLIEVIEREIKDFPLAPGALLTLARAAGTKVAQAAVDVLTAALNVKRAETRLVIGLDQFEEILDDLSDTRRKISASRWQLLLSFVSLAAKSGRFGFVYTLESSRRALFEKGGLPEVFRSAYVQDLGGYDFKFLTSVIQLPFQNAGHRLAPKIITELIDLFQKYSAKIQPQASALPLLALKLSNLFDTVQALGKARPSGDTLQEQFEEQGADVSYEEVKNELAFEREIEELANRAWGEQDSSEEDQLYDLNFFLQPLATSSGDDDRITLQTIGESRLSTMRERLAAFQDVRLVIRENGRLRLVHEAVIRQWSLAAKWWERHRDYLHDEAVFRALANKWHTRGEQESSLPTDVAAVDTAVAVLVSQFHNWAFADLDQMNPGDQNLKKYCQAIFRLKIDPSRLVILGTFGEWGAHVHVAAAYEEMSDLLGLMIEQDPECVHLETRKKRSTPLDLAAWVGVHTVRLLVDSGADPVHFDSQGWSTISAAIWQGSQEIFRILQPYYVRAEQITAPGQMNLLHVAARRDEADMAATLLTTVENADPMKEDEWGRTPLDWAAFSEKPRTLAFFLEHCDVRHRSPRSGWTVLHWAAYGGSLQAVNTILRLGEFSDLIDSTDNAGKTALMVAAEYRRAAVVARLAEVLDVNQQCTESSNRGWTALHFAVAGDGRFTRETRASRQEALRAVRVLLERPGINPRLQDEQGREPISLAGSLPQVRRELTSHDSFDWSDRLADGTTPLNYVVAAKDRPAVERMLTRSKLDVEILSNNGDYVLKLLIVSDMADLALKLFDSGRVHPWKVNGARDVGLSSAIGGGHKALVTAYLNQLPLPALPAHRRLLTDAANSALIQGDAETFERLIDLGVEAGPIDKIGWSLQHVAAALGDITAYDKLASAMSVGALPDKWGRLPVELAPDRVHDEFERRTPLPRSIGRSVGDLFSFSDEAWSVLEDTNAIFEQIGRLIDKSLEVDFTVLVRRRPLPMYEHVQLLCLTSPKWKEGLRICYLENEGQLFRLNGTSPPIHEVNARAPIRLTDEDAGYYLSFFCLFVQGEEGPFYIIHDLADELLPAGAGSPQTAGKPRGRTLGDIFRRPKYLGKSDTGSWRFSAMVYYSNAIFLTDFEVQPLGMVEMVDDQPLITDLSLRMPVYLTERL